MNIFPLVPAVKRTPDSSWDGTASSSTSIAYLGAVRLQIGVGVKVRAVKPFIPVGIPQILLLWITKYKIRHAVLAMSHAFFQ